VGFETECKKKNMAIGDTLRDLHLEDGKGTINQVNDYTYLGVKITKDGNCEPEITDRINNSNFVFPGNTS
jgi:hypothetical protein